MYTIMSNSKLISIKTAAMILGVHAQTLRAWDKSGKYPAGRTEKGQRRYDYDEVINLLKERKNK
jgi:DNA-binding transcriptional MerR regulator